MSWFLEARELAGRVAPTGSFAQSEAQLRGGEVAGVAGFGDHLPALDLIAALDVEFAVVAVSADEAVGVLDEHEVAVAFEPVARVDDDPALGRPDRRASGHGDVDAVVAAGLEPLDDAP